MAINTKKYIENYLKIQDKKANIIQFKLNKPQQKLYNALKKQAAEGKPQRIIVLKARQMGFSTLTEAIIFKKTVTAFNIKSGIVAHDTQSTNNLFNIFKRYYNNLDMELRPSIINSNAKELIFNNREGTGLNSSIKLMTAGNENAGRSDTYQNLHISEYAFWGNNKKNVLLGMLQAVPDEPNTTVVIESTANGFDDFKERWDDAVNGNSDYIPVFCAWYEMNEYRRPYDGFTLTKEEEEIKTLYNLDNEQIAWRRYCIRNNCGNDVQLFKQEYPSCPEEAFISTGNCIFDKDNIIRHIEQIKANKPIKQGYFTYKYDGSSISNITWVEDKEGIIKIYKDVKENVPYVLGGDTAGEGSDNFIGEVIDNTTGEQVAELAQQTDEDLYARQMYCLGMYYNNALIGLEVNFSSFPQKELERLKYKNFYMRETEDSITKKVQMKNGFRTTSITRPIILAGLVEIVREEIDKINSIELLREMLTFVKNENGRAEAEGGKHDDRVIAMAITYYIRTQQKMTTIEKKEQTYKQKMQNLELRNYINYGGGYG